MTASRPRARRAAILDTLRREIIQDKFPPGAQLPTRAALERRFRTTPVTIQRVFDVLSQEGFVVPRGRRGTFVSDAPPHLTRYGLVFPYRPHPQHPWPQFWHALAAEAEAHLQGIGQTLTLSYGNETHEDLDAYERLLADVVNRRMAGLIFASKPFYLKGSPVLEAPGIPRVAIMPNADIPGVCAVRLAGKLVSRLLAALVGNGRRRIAVVTSPQSEADVIADLRAAGIDFRPYWVQLAHYGAPHVARNAVHLLMAAAPGDRPDGLVITDDSLVEQATMGLVDAGVGVPEQVMVAAHANFPSVTRSAVPAVRMGYDMRAVLAACAEALDRQRRGEDGPDVVEISTATENEVVALAMKRPDKQKN
jgi:DNA-binding LacI/PurR family transcriptional regulator